jgi:ATP-dependent Zn protease
MEEARERAATIVRENRALLETLRDLLLEKKVIDARTLGDLTTGQNGSKRKVKASQG